MKARVIAFYLPQFHPIPENDEWWGKGFTEWTNVAKARPLFPGHDQPRVPRDLGFYDLRVPETRQAQADMARVAGVEGFCYWHYWFAGRRILERPFQEVLDSGKPDFPFCLAWANQTWSGVWHGSDRILVEQTYPGEEDYTAHFRYLLGAFRDPRYMRVDGRPIFCVYAPLELPDAKRVTDLWRSLASKAGLPGLHLVALGNGESAYDAGALGFDAHSNSNQTRIHWFVHEPGFRGALARTRSDSALWDKLLVAKYAAKSRLDRALGRAPFVYSYRDALEFFVSRESFGVPSHPTVIPNWDHSPRCGGRGVILHEATPQLFRRHVTESLRQVADQPAETRIVFVKSWNEWAEGNYLEPDLRWGDAYLRVLGEELEVAAPAPEKDRSVGRVARAAGAA